MIAILTRQRLAPITLFFGISFLLHLLWENLQAPLYRGYISFSQHFWICLRGALGDLIFMFALYLAIALIHRNLFWLNESSILRPPLTWIILIVLGGVFAAAFEWWAVFVAHRWQYGSMPLLFGGIGLMPVLQMTVIPPISLFLTFRFFRPV